MNMKLEIGYNHPIEIRHYAYFFPPLAGTRILYVSDLHYHRLSRQRATNNIGQIRQLNPHIILLGGDYVDTAFGLRNLQYLADSIGPIPTFVIAGNHDNPYRHRIRRIVENAGATWLHNLSTTVQLGRQFIRIDGNRPFPSDDSQFSILCLHRPIDIRPFARHYNLIFAGHLHGGQFVFWQTPAGLYPGRWLFRWNQLDADYGTCRYLISKGAGDTFPIRYNCSRDMILVTLQSQPGTP